MSPFLSWHDKYFGKSVGENVIIIVMRLRRRQRRERVRQSVIAKEAAKERNAGLWVCMVRDVIKIFGQILLLYYAEKGQEGIKSCGCLSEFTLFYESPVGCNKI